MNLNWHYSRRQRRHWVEDGEYYGKNFVRLFEIKNCAPYGQYHRPYHGYDLLFKGKKISHSKTVKMLKDRAAAWLSTKEYFAKRQKPGQT